CAREGVTTLYWYFDVW
nr:immunoglobulin heavy chain junction region [Mus musculus]